MLRKPLQVYLLVFVCIASSLSAQPPASGVQSIYHSEYEKRLVPLLTEIIRFPTVADNAEAAVRQRAWLKGAATELGLVFRDAGSVAEVEVPGPKESPVLGLVAHGDVMVPGDEWSFPPFEATARGGFLYGRGVVDNKGPIIQAMLAMAAFRKSGLPRTHTVRLLVGSDEESGSSDMASYLKTHKAPDLSLVIDSSFPVVVGEKAWNAMTVTATDPFTVRQAKDASAHWAITRIDAGTAISIVPRNATAKLRWLPESLAGFTKEAASLGLPASVAGCTFAVAVQGREATVTVTGRAAHAGMSIETGRNALVPLAARLIKHVAPSGARDLLAFAALAGQDLHGAALGLTGNDRLWGGVIVNVATVKPESDGSLVLAINVRVGPQLIGEELRRHLEQCLAEFNAATGAKLIPGGYYESKLLVIDPESRIVKRLLAAYRRGTGREGRPIVAGGAGYASRLPNAIPFGTWFSETPYTGHGVDERISVRDLHRGVDVLIEAIVDLACSPALERPFAK